MAEIWIFGGCKKTDRAVRNEWLSEKRQFNVLANAWKETLRDAMSDIQAHREAAKVQARRAVARHTEDEEERKRLYGLLRRDEWMEDPYLRRIMRKYWHRGHNHVANQIIIRSDNYTTFTLGSRVWLKIPGLERGKRIAIPLNTTVAPTGTLRLILRHERVEVHYAIEVKEEINCGHERLGVDKGYTEVLVDSDKEHHGQELGPMLSSESDNLKVKHQRRNKLRAIAEKKPHKKHRIKRNNLGRKKLNKRSNRFKKRIRDVVFKAVHKVVDKASVIATEDLSSPMTGRKFGKDITRRLSSWTKGVIAEALSLVSQRRGSTLVFVNAAYTSQVDSRNGVLSGQRRGDTFYCEDGEVMQADENAAQNVLARLDDPEIDRWTPFKKVRSILLERTKRHRLGLLNQDSSCSGLSLSTESELPNEQFCITF